MKIAILADPLDNQNAGVHIFTKSLIEELISSDDAHTYVLVRQKYDPSLPDKVKQIVIPVKPIPGFASLRLFVQVPLALRKEKVDVVIEPAHFGPFNLPSSIKRMTVIHDLTPIIFPEHHTWHGQILQRIFLSRILSKTDHVITNSQNTSRDLEHYYPNTKDKNTAILLGKDRSYTPTIDPQVLIDNGIRNRYFLTVGTIEPRKNLELLLSAFEKVIDESQEDISLVIAGGLGWKTESFEKALAEHPYRDKIIMLGYVDKKILPALYSQAIALIYPSIYEGFGFPVLEGMSCGVPVICANVSSLPEVGGSLALYIDPTSERDLIGHMQTALAYTVEEREAIKDKSVTHSDQYSWKNHAATFLSVIDKLVNH